MNRRSFIQAATCSLFVPTVVTATHDQALASEQPAWDYIFYDERFANARLLAGEGSGSTLLTPVRGDITDVWKAGLDRVSRTSALTMRGVTTESFHFCLKIMVGEHASLDTQMSRLDRDLVLWTMRTAP